MTPDYINVNLIARDYQYYAKIEKGCSFENNGYIYRADESGTLKVFDKQKGTWTSTNSVAMTNYQLKTFQAISGNIKEEGDTIILSKADIKTAMKQYQKGNFIKTITEFIQSGYRADKAKLYSRYNTISTHVTNDSGSESNMLFGYGSKKSALAISQIANNTQLTPIQLGRIRKTTDGGQYWISHPNILYRIPKLHTTTEATSNGIAIANKYGISLYRLRRTNPTIDFDKPLTPGTKVKIPGRYFIKPGSVRSFKDVVDTTGLNKNYIEDILIGIEGRNKKPDLKAYYDGIGNANHPKGYLTIGFGHTGTIKGKPLTKNTQITEAQAYEMLAQDILNAKIDAIIYMGKETFNSAPKSIQTGIIDIIFNKGVEPFSREGSPTVMLKKDLGNRDYISAAADTILGKTTCKGLKKRNIYRAIMSISDLSEQERKNALIKIKPFYEEVLKLYEGTEKKLLQRAWDNALKGKTYGFFPIKIARVLL